MPKFSEDDIKKLFQQVEELSLKQTVHQGRNQAVSNANQLSKKVVDLNELGTQLQNSIDAINKTDIILDTLLELEKKSCSPKGLIRHYQRNYTQGYLDINRAVANFDSFTKPNGVRDHLNRFTAVLEAIKSIPDIEFRDALSSWISDIEVSTWQNKLSNAHRFTNNELTNNLIKFYQQLQSAITQTNNHHCKNGLRKGVEFIMRWYRGELPQTITEQNILSIIEKLIRLNERYEAYENKMIVLCKQGKNPFTHTGLPGSHNTSRISICYNAVDNNLAGLDSLNDLLDKEEQTPTETAKEKIVAKPLSPVVEREEPRSKEDVTNSPSVVTSYYFESFEETSSTYTHFSGNFIAPSNTTIIKNDSITPKVRTRDELKNIVTTLMANMRNKKNRLTSGEGSEKYNLLDEVLKKLENSENPINPESIVQEIKNISIMQRNPWHFWKTPESVGELEELLEQPSITPL